MLWLIGACLLWGPSFGLVPILQKEYGMNSYMLAVLRIGFAFILFMPLMGHRPVSLKRKVQLAVLGGLQFGLMYVLLFKSYKFLEGYEVALATILTPMYVTLLDNRINRQRLRAVSVLCVMLAVAGAGVVRLAKSDYSHPELDTAFWIGFCLMQLCNLCFATGQVVYRKILRPGNNLSSMYVFGWMYLGALFVVLLGWGIMAPVGETLLNLRSLPLKAWGIILWLGLIPSGLAFFMFNHGALKVDTGNLAIINNLKIPIALIIVLALFNQQEHIASWPLFFLGTALMLSALWWNTRFAEDPAEPKT